MQPCTLVVTEPVQSLCYSPNFIQNPTATNNQQPNSCATRQPHVTKKKRKNQISSEGYCSSRSVARDIISITTGLTPYLHSRARASSLWTAGQEEWCCRSHGARCTQSHSKCFSSGVHMPKQIIQHGWLAQSHRRSLRPRQSMHEQDHSASPSPHKPIVLSLHSTISR